MIRFFCDLVKRLRWRSGFKEIRCRKIAADFFVQAKPLRMQTTGSE